MRGGLVAACLWLATALAQAQVTAALGESAALECLTPSPALRGDAEYPPHALKARQRGKVDVELTFTRPDQAPAFQVLAEEGGSDFVDAVRKHLQDFRVPCQDPAHPPTRLRLSFDFVPDGRKVYGSDPEDQGAPQRRDLLKCVTHTSGKEALDYPMEAWRQHVVGIVVTQLTYTAPDLPPEARIHARPAAKLLARGVEDWVKGLRMPCHQGGPLPALVEFRFVFEGDRAFGFKPGLTFMQLLGVTKGINEQTLRFNTAEMGCPFELKFTYRQPLLPNLVGQVGNADPRRRALLLWLRGIELDLPARALDAVFGDSVNFIVPCLNINLTPKEKTS